MRNNYPPKIKEKLKNSCIGIAGLGGLGSNAAVSLARSGIGKLILIDFDRIEESNLNRQYYFKDQIGKYKTEALAENIKRINEEIELIIFNTILEPNNMVKYFKDADIIIEALDKAEMKSKFIEKIQLELPNIPLIGASGVAGYGNSDSIVTKDLDNLYMVYDENAPSSDEGILVAPRVCLFANWEANIALSILLEDYNDNRS